MNKVETYLDTLSSLEKKELLRIRERIKEAAPNAVEGISYGMPGFKYKGKYLIGYAAYRDHMSIFPTPGPIEKIKEKLADYRLAKGTVQFTLEHPITDELVRELVAIRMSEIDS